MWTSFASAYFRKKHGTVLWHGNREGPWHETLRVLVWPAFKRAFENRRQLPELFTRRSHIRVHRLRSDDAVRSFVGAVKHV